MRNYQALSFSEYEKLIGDLLGAQRGVRFERFGSGADGGIDLRHAGSDAGPEVVQVKHYLGSSWSSLKTAAGKERKRLETLTPAPSSYTFVTSQSLSPKRKLELMGTLAPFTSQPDDVLGGEEIDDLLDHHSAVERRHVKLWLASAAGLKAAVGAGQVNRTNELIAEIGRKLPLWVQGEAFEAAREQLEKERVLIVSGEPGIGKTTMAQLLVADAVDRGYEPVAVSADVEEAWSALDASTPQVFLYDDFLGQTSFIELSKNEDSRLVAFMRETALTSTNLFVLTTREYILQRAVQTSERLRQQGLSAKRILLQLPSYSALDRARILANHVWHSQRLSPSVREELADARGYRRIVNHPNYNPRLIEFVTGHSGSGLESASGTWLDRAIRALDHPHEIWRGAYERQLGPVERGLTLVLATFPRLADVGDLERAHDAWCATTASPASPRRFERALTTPRCQMVCGAA